MMQAFSRTFPFALALLMTTGCASQQERKPAIILEQEQATKNSRFVAAVPAGWTVSQATELKSGVTQMFVPPGQRSDGTSTTVLVLYGLDGAKTLPQARQMLEQFGRAQMKGQPVTDLKEVKVGERQAMFGVGHTETGDKGPSDYVFLAMPDGDHLLLAVYMGDEDAVSVGLKEAMSVVVSVRFKTAPSEGDTRSPSSADPIEANSQLARHLDALLDELILLSLQPGNDEDENKAVSDAIDAAHEAGIQLYDDLNRCEYSHEALAPLISRYLALRERTAVLVTAHGPVRTHLPAPFAAMRRDVEQVIALIRLEIHGDNEPEPSRENAIAQLHHAAGELRDDLIWSGLRKRHEDVADLQARFAAVRKGSRELYP